MCADHGRSILIIFILLSLLLGGCSTSDGLNIDCHVFEDNFDQVAEIMVTEGVWTYQLAVTVNPAAE